jgi:hypothetical protein
VRGYDFVSYSDWGILDPGIPPKDAEVLVRMHWAGHPSTIHIFNPRIPVAGVAVLMRRRCGFLTLARFKTRFLSNESLSSFDALILAGHAARRTFPPDLINIVFHETFSAAPMLVRDLTLF